MLSTTRLVSLVVEYNHERSATPDYIETVY
jgi:hypothetical protein